MATSPGVLQEVSNHHTDGICVKRHIKQDVRGFLRVFGDYLWLEYCIYVTIYAYDGVWSRFLINFLPFLDNVREELIFTFKIRRISC